jgi:predicted transcriptional regulator of viral defense system
MPRRLGHLETQVLAYAQMRRQQAIRTVELARSLRLPPQQVQEVITRLRRSGMAARVRRGLYLVPPRLPLGDVWSPDETLALNTLMEDRKARFQICGPSAFSRYGLDEQVATRLYVYNNRLSGDRTIGTVQLALIKVADGRLGGTEDVVTPEGLRAVYSSRARTLIDAVYDWSRFGSLPRGYEWIRRELSAGRVTAAELVRIAVRYSNQATQQRIGFLLDCEGVSRSSLAPLRRSLGPSPSVIPWNPTGPRRGAVAHRWEIIINKSH